MAVPGRCAALTACLLAGCVDLGPPAEIAADADDWRGVRRPGGGDAREAAAAGAAEVAVPATTPDAGSAAPDRMPAAVADGPGPGRDGTAPAPDAVDAAVPDTAAFDLRPAAETPPPRPNAAPSVRAGADQTLLTLMAQARLSGMVADDGLPAPPGRLTVTWTRQSGPGTVTFANPAAPETSARFAQTGAYVLRLSASDGAETTHDDVAVTVLGLDVSLAGHWRFDETSGTVARDASGGGNHATLMGVAGWAAGRIQGAIDLSGDQDLALVTDPADGRLDFGTGDFSVCVWLKTSQTFDAQTAFPEVVNKWEGDGAASRRGWELFFWNTTRVAAFKLMEGQGFEGLETAGASDGRWHHVAGRRRTGELAIFLDGRPAASRMVATGSVSSTAALNIGGFGGAGWADFDGQLDDLRIYGRSLSEAEIAALAGGASP